MDNVFDFRERLVEEYSAFPRSLPRDLRRGWRFNNPNREVR